MKDRSKNGRGAKKKSSPIITYQLQAVLQQALTCHQRGSPTQAEMLYEQLVKMDPHYFDVLPHYARLAYETGRPQLAADLLCRAVKIKPGVASLHSNLGLVLCEINRFDDALVSYDNAISLGPENAAVQVCRATILTRLGRLQEALASYDRAIAIRPGEAEFHYARGFILNELVEPDRAREAFTKVLELNPDHHRARWCLVFSNLPAIFHSEKEVEVSRESFELALNGLSKWFDEARLDRAEEAVAAMQPFYLAYQEKDNKCILSAYGSLTNHLMLHWQNKNNIRHGISSKRKKIRIGVVSSVVRDHPVWDAIAAGWLLHFDSNIFEWYVFSLASTRSNTTELVRDKATLFIENVGGLKEWASAIVENEIEVLIYPEIGMEGLTTQLANLRLAPLQIATWGHPETTGLKTIDYYLSAELFEPEDGDSRYVESLIKLPNLGCTYRPHQIEATSLNIETLNINPELPLLLCPGTAFKYSPKHDGVFPEIAHKLGRCTFVFFEQKPHHVSILKSRLKSAFLKRGLEFDEYVKFIPWLSRNNFYALMKRSNVFLDTIGFSGFNTAMQAIECSLPVVGFEGRFMRGRLASGILKRLELDELICSSEEDYCNTVVRVVQDSYFRNQVISRIESRRAMLYDDLAPLRALERFVVDWRTTIDMAEL